MYYGSSSVYAFYNSTLAYDKYGFTTGLMASDGQPFIAERYLATEALKYQNPKVHIFDIDSIPNGVTKYNEGDIRKVIDNMKFSKNKIELTKELLKYYENDADEKSFYLPFLYYHSSWKDISMEKVKPTTIYKGSLLSKASVISEPQVKNEWVYEEEPLSKVDYDQLMNLINYIKDNNLDAILVISKRYFTTDAMKNFNYISRIAKENNITVINFNTLEDFDVDYESDFYNRGHLNASGSAKFTLYLANYLKNNYSLPDHRSDSNYKSWSNTYSKYKKDYKKLTNKNYDDLLKEIESVK